MEEESLQEDGESLSVTLGVNRHCPSTKYLISVSFGVRSEGNDCEGLRNVSGQSLSPGDSATFSVHSFGLPSNDYCYILSLSQETGEWIIKHLLTLSKMHIIISVHISISAPAIDDVRGNLSLT